MGSDEELSRRMRHNGIHPDSLPGEAGKQVRVGVWAPENRFLAPAGNVVAEGSEGEPHENIPLGKERPRASLPWEQSNTVSW